MCEYENVALGMTEVLVVELPILDCPTGREPSVSLGFYTADEGELDSVGRSTGLDESRGAWFCSRSAREGVVRRPGKFTVHLPARTW